MYMRVSTIPKFVIAGAVNTSIGDIAENKIPRQKSSLKDPSYV
jgi:hypothetical protein